MCVFVCERDVPPGENEWGNVSKVEKTINFTIQWENKKCIYKYNRFLKIMVKNHNIHLNYRKCTVQ